MNSLHAPATAAIIGASGGVGAALLQQVQDNEAVDKVYGLSRSPQSGGGKLETMSIDITDESSIAEAAAAIDSPLDLVIVATGILHRGDEIRPEKSIRELSAATMQDVFAINAIGPALVAKHFLPKLRRKHKAVFAAISARVGSIGDNRLGGWSSYRASKAALNMLLKNFSIEHGRTRPDSVIVGLHPGTVDTALSKPFQARVPDGKLFSPAQSAGYLLDVIDGLTPADSGGVFAWDGQRIEY